MANFRVNDTFYIESQQCFVIAGQIITGEIMSGDNFIYQSAQSNIIFSINQINFLDKLKKGKTISEVAISIKGTKDMFSKLVLNGRTFEINNLQLDSAERLESSNEDWENVENDCCEKLIGKDNGTNIFNWLKQNYNPPTKK